MSKRRVTLTFDNGPKAGATERVLATLAERGVRATFFVVGQDAARPEARELLAQVVGKGHWVGNHTMTHSVLFGETLDDELLEREVGHAQTVIQKFAHPDKLFRPWGHGKLGPHLLSPALVEYLSDGGYTCVLWNSVPRDWEQWEAWVDTCLADVLANDWTVVVLHDSEERAMDQLGPFLDRLDEAAVELVQEFPTSCVPIRRGVVQGGLGGLMTTVRGG